MIASLDRGAKQTVGRIPMPRAACSASVVVGSVAVRVAAGCCGLEQLSYESGPLLTPAQVSQQALQRELHAGVAVSSQVQDAFRLGVSGSVRAAR
jgi:hypothetical protein